MSRGKKKGKSKSNAKGGSAKSTPHRAPAKRHSLRDEAIAPKFSLKDEARWMSSHRTTAFEAGNKLRNMPIQFVSAGHLQGTLKEPSQAEPATPESPASMPDNAEAMAHMAIRSPSPVPSEASSSSADEVLFRGRAAQPAAAPSTNTPHNPTPAPLVPSSHPATASTTEQPTLPTETAEAQAPAEPGSDADQVDQRQFAKRRRGRPAWEGTTPEWEHRSKPNIGWLPAAERPNTHADSRDAALDDSMQNVEDFGFTEDLLAASAFAHREMDLDAGNHNDWEPASAIEGAGQNGKDSAGWDSDLLHDFDDLSTSSDVVDTIVQILSKRTRKSGLHYLCVYEGSVADDARWLPATFLKKPAEKRMIQVFEDEAFEREQQMLTSSDSADEYEDVDEEDDDDDDDEDDDEDAYADELDDETIARVLQKQEELGLGADELLLYGGDDFFGAPSRSKDASFGGYGRSNKKRQNRVRSNREPSFPSASAMVAALEMDPYGAFDIMDTERPSLKPKKKGRRGQPPPELDDSDLNEQLQNAWAADRAKKRLKKAEREELRQQGLLGRKGKSPSLKVKYQGGIDMEDIVEELREFMVGDMHTLSLPPMEAYRRATVHQVAAFFDLSSRSRGDGMNRFTVLSKTNRTRTYTDDEFGIAIQKKGFQQRLRGPLYSQGGGGRPGKFSTVKHKQGGVRSRPQLGYKDGETVGANAPELGPENKGHALMMKMGWSTGTALGATDNKGILKPIPHTVKTNKAGLQ
ncbi:squalene synthetase-like protein [Exserohilum turcicum]